MSELDADKTPTFPVYNITLADDGTVTLDGTAVRVDGYPSARAAGTAAAARRAGEEGLKAVRALATDREGRTLLIISSEGDVIAVPEAPPERKRHIGFRIGLIALAAVVLTSGTGAIAYTVTSQSQAVATTAPAATPPPPPPGAGMNIPVIAPPGYSQVATWAWPIDKSTTVTPTREGLAFTGTNSSFNIHGYGDGRTLWAAASAPTSDTALTRVDGAEAIVNIKSRNLEIRDTTGEQPTPTQLVPLPSSTVEASFNGPAPLLDLGDQTVLFLQREKIVRLDIPVGGTPVMATADRVIAIGTNEWWSIAGDGTTAPHVVPKPEGARSLDAAVALDDSHLLTVWEAAGQQIVTIISLTKNVTVAEMSTPDNLTKVGSELIRSSTPAAAAYGRVFATYGDRPSLALLPKMTVTAVNGTSVYGRASNAAVVAEPGHDGYTLAPFTTDKTVDSVSPIYVTDSFAYLVATKVDETYLYALPASGDPE